MNILGQDVKISRVKDLKDDDGKRVTGLYCPIEFVIEIDKELNGQHFWAAFYHEYGHAIVQILGVHNVEFSDVLEELLCDNLGRDLAKNFNNKFRFD